MKKLSTDQHDTQWQCLWELWHYIINGQVAQPQNLLKTPGVTFHKTNI